MESHQRDHENFLVVSRNRRRRAKALLDFERHDDDELGFRKNDIITVSTCCFCHLNMLTDALPLFFDCISVFILRSSHRKMSTAGLESWTAWEVSWDSIIISIEHFFDNYTFILFLITTQSVFLTTLITYIKLIKSTSISHKPFVPLGWFPAKFVEVLDERSKEVIALLLDCLNSC